MHENGSCWNDLCEQELNQQNQLTLGAIFVLRIQVVFKQLKLKSTIYITKKEAVLFETMSGYCGQSIQVCCRTVVDVIDIQKSDAII
jgi:hypothetical protein